MIDRQACALCGLDCGIRPLILQTAERSLPFCCEGCRGIYQMLHEINDVPPDSPQNGNEGT